MNPETGAVVALYTATVPSNIFEALENGDLRPLREWLSYIEVQTDRLIELPSGQTPQPLRQSSVGISGTHEGVSAATAQLLAQWPKAAANPLGVPLLLLLVHVAVDGAWNISYRYQAMWDTLRSAVDCALNRGGELSSADQLAARAVVSLMQSLAHQISAENSLVTGQLLQQRSDYTAAASHATTAIELANRVGEHNESLGNLIRNWATEYKLRGEIGARSAEKLYRFYMHGEELEEVIAELENVEKNTEFHDLGYLSEIRADRLSLSALNEKKNSPWVKVSRGKVVYVYPFSLRGISPIQVLKLVSENARQWELAGATPATVNNSLRLDDVWNGSDAFKRQYEGALISLPEVEVRNIDGQRLRHVKAEVRFSKLGNHYVRFTADVTDAGPADLYAMALQGTSEFGYLRINFRDRREQDWIRLAYLAKDIAENVAVRLNELNASTSVTTSHGPFHVVLAVHAAFTSIGPTSNHVTGEIRTVEELLTTFGSEILVNPVTQLVGALAEWSRYTKGDYPTNSITDLTGQEIVRTPNTTAIISPGAADFTQRTRTTMVEFAASVEGLFAGWSEELVDHYSRIRHFRDRIDRANRDSRASVRQLATLARELEAEQNNLHSFATGVRSTIALFNSPYLTASPVLSNFLRLVLERGGFQYKVAELNAMLEDISKDQLGAAIEKLTKQREEQEALAVERERRARQGKMEVFLGVIATMGISGVVQVLQVGFFEDENAAVWALASVSTILVLAVTLGISFWPRND